MMLGTSDHNIEVGGCGGKQGISVVSCGWLFFLKNPVSSYLIQESCNSWNGNVGSRGFVWKVPQNPNVLTESCPFMFLIKMTMEPDPHCDIIGELGLGRQHAEMKVTGMFHRRVPPNIFKKWRCKWENENKPLEQFSSAPPPKNSASFRSRFCRSPDITDVLKMIAALCGKCIWVSTSCTPSHMFYHESCSLLKECMFCGLSPYLRQILGELCGKSWCRLNP